MLKDFNLIKQVAAATSYDMPLISSIEGMYRDVAARGFGDQDFFVLTSGDSARAPGDK